MGQSAPLQPLRAHLQSRDYDYGDFPTHTGLWDMTEKTKSDVLVRMALVPRPLEACGLDATPSTQAKLREVGSPHIKGPLNLSTRRAARFDDAELARLQLNA